MSYKVMNTPIPVLDYGQIAEICRSALPDHAHQSLIAALTGHFPNIPFTIIHSQRGWYRTGGAITSKGEKITDDLVQWAYNEGEKDFVGLLEYCRVAGLFATRVDGEMHYIVAPYGPRAMDFVQIEVEETQEVLDRPLYGRRIPLDIEDFIDPLSKPEGSNRPLGPSRYRLKQLTFISDLFEDVQQHEIERSKVLRFLNDWDRSSAARQHRFCHHWIFKIHYYTGRYNDQRHSVGLASTYSKSVPRIDCEEIEHGSPLANLIHHFDYRLGYPMAWYFYLLTQNMISADFAHTVCDDHDRGYAYLPEPDLGILKDWLEEPYLR